MGRIRDKEFSYFIDFMEASVDHREGERLARALASFIKDAMSSLNNDPPISFDAIVVPKGGSPVLGFLVSRVLNCRCILFRGEEHPKIRGEARPEYYLDGVIDPGESVILVDDSSTGGSMMLETVRKLRDIGANVAHAFILFEPAGGTAAEVLQRNEIRLHSIVRVDNEFLKQMK